MIGALSLDALVSWTGASLFHYTCCAMRTSILFAAVALFASAAVATSGTSEQRVHDRGPTKSVVAAPSANEVATVTAFRLPEVGTLAPVTVIGCPGCHASRDAGAPVLRGVAVCSIASSGGMPG